MAIDLEDDSWTLHLETALLDQNCSAHVIQNICKGRSLPESVRPEVWQACLGVRSAANHMLHFNDIFDLTEQTLLRDDCQQFVANLGNEDEDKVCVLSDLESILTRYCKSNDVQYERGNGWIEMMLPLISLKLPRSQTYNLFETIRHRYVPRSCKKNDTVFHVLRLLLLYHDPELCSFLDTMKISPDLYCTSWVRSLFAATCSLPVVLRMWDVYFQSADCFLLCFLAIVIILNAREHILSLKGDTQHAVVAKLASMPCALEAGDVADLCSLAQYYALKTPSSFKERLADVLFGNEEEEDNLAQALCLPVSAGELVENTSSAETELVPVPELLRFFLVDCRPAEQYNAGHLPTAFHLDCNLMLQEPAAFVTAVQGLLSAQRQALAARCAAGGEHLCFLGSGRLDEDQYTHMVVASFLQKNTHHVSMLSGGYLAIHEYLDKDVDIGLDEHSAHRCVVCIADAESRRYRADELHGTAAGPGSSSSSSDIFNKLSAAVKSKSAEVRGKLFEYIVNPSGSGSVERHVSSSDKLGKRYRNLAPVFSIDDEHEPEAQGIVDGAQQVEQHHEVVSVPEWLDKPDVIESFRCHEVKMNGYMYDSYLLVTDSHVYVLRDIPGRRGWAHVAVRRPLSAIVKITSRKKHPELITFKYGAPDGDNLVISDMDRFLIPDAVKATRLISQLIMKQTKACDG